MLELKVKIKDSETGYAVTDTKNLSIDYKMGETFELDAIRQALLEMVEMIVPNYACEKFKEE